MAGRLTISLPTDPAAAHEVLQNAVEQVRAHLAEHPPRQRGRPAHLRPQSARQQEGASPA